jgi:hypothetical protein
VAEDHAILQHVVVVVVVAPLPEVREAEERQGHRSSASARRPASVIRMRVTLSGRPPATIGSALAVARPALISSASISLLKPWARKIASVQPSGAVSSNSSARRRSRLGPRVRRRRGVGISVRALLPLLRTACPRPTKFTIPQVAKADRAPPAAANEIAWPLTEAAPPASPQKIPGSQPAA